MLVNISPKKSDLWSPEQIRAASVFGGVLDYDIPYISPYLTEEEVEMIAEKTAQEIAELHPRAVCCQGEMSFSYRVARKLLIKGIFVVAAVTDVINDKGGTTFKKFVQFRNLV